MLEEETDPRRFSIHRLGHYCLDLAELCATERVVPVVIFLRRSPAIPSSLALGSETTQYLQFHYLKCELAALPATDYEQSDNLVARLNLMNMELKPSDRVRLYAQAIRGLLQLDNNPRRHAKYLDFIDSYAALTDNERMQYERQFSEESEVMTGIVSRAREEGVQQGMQQGIQQGLSQGEAKGERTILERLLKRRFGKLDASTRARLDNASTEELEQWAENIIEAGSLDEVFTQR